MKPVDLLIEHGLVVTMDDDSTVLEDGSVAVLGTDIVAVGSAADLEGRFSPARRVDASGKLVMPGLINGHSHIPDSLFRGLVEDLPLEPWLDALWKAEKTFVSPETVRLGAQLGMAEMIRGGTTTALDMFWWPEASIEVAREIGFRLMTGPTYFDPEAPDGLAKEERTERGRALLETYRDDPLVSLSVMPHWALTVSEPYLLEAKVLADDLGVLLSTHVAETAASRAQILERYGKTEVHYLNGLGLLDERSVLAHCIHVSDEEIELLAKRRAVVAHNPLANLKLGDGIAPIPKMLDAGVRVILGTDGPVSSNDLDLWKVIRLAGVLHRGVHEDPTLLPARNVVHMVTRGAAEALGLDHRIGSLEVGKRADLLVIELGRPHLVPRYDPYALLAYSVGRDDVSTVVIDGRVVLDDGELKTVDERQVIAEMQSLAERIAASS